MKAFASRFCSLVFLHLRIVMAALWYRLPARIELIVNPYARARLTLPRTGKRGGISDTLDPLRSSSPLLAGPHRDV